MKLLAPILATLISPTLSLTLPIDTTANNPAPAILRARQQTGFQLHQCAIIGTGNAHCRTCASSSCPSVKTLIHGRKYEFDCVCRAGQCVDGFCGWDYYVAGDCWVWALRTDNNCPTKGANGLTECAYCSR